MMIITFVSRKTDGITFFVDCSDLSYFGDEQMVSDLSNSILIEDYSGRSKLHILLKIGFYPY